MNELSFRPPVHQIGLPRNGQAGGHPKPAENRCFLALSITFSFKFKKRRSEKKLGYTRARGDMMDRGFADGHPAVAIGHLSRPVGLLP